MSLDRLEKAQDGPQFHSKKNRVFRSSLDGKSYVVKVYRGEWRDRAKVEYDILTDCVRKRVPVPTPVALLEGAIVMTVVEGQVAGEVYDRLIVAPTRLSLSSEAERLADSLARWLANFHSAFDFKLSRGDTILKNFIITGDGAVGLDFEETTSADTLSDLGQLCASVLMNDPAFSGHKMEFAGRLAERYWACSGQRREDELAGAVSTAIRYYSQFRSNGQKLLSFASKLDRREIEI